MKNFSAALIAIAGLASLTRLAESGNNGAATAVAVLTAVFCLSMIGSKP
jgi:hypothetical protein